MFRLAQEIGCHIFQISSRISNDSHFGGAGGHIDGDITQRDELLRHLYELIARTKNLIDLGYRLGAECHRSNCLNSATLIDFGDTSDLSSK